MKKKLSILLAVVLLLTMVLSIGSSAVAEGGRTQKLVLSMPEINAESSGAAIILAKSTANGNTTSQDILSDFLISLL